jgi:hypothetical protein
MAVTGWTRRTANASSDLKRGIRSMFQTVDLQCNKKIINTQSRLAFAD